MSRKRQRHRKTGKVLFVFVVLVFAGILCLGNPKGLLDLEPEEVRTLRQKGTVQTDAGHQEYYFHLLDEEEQKIYREMLDGIRERQEEIYLTTADENLISKAYHAVLKDHSELFWVHNRKNVYTTSYKGDAYCRFSPGYIYTEAEITEITAAMEQAFTEVNGQITEETDTYDKVKAVYSYLIDLAEYESSDDDQNIAGIFWKKRAVWKHLDGRWRLGAGKLPQPMRAGNRSWRIRSGGCRMRFRSMRSRRKNGRHMKLWNISGRL